jgi:protocatechuate 3,4-dioxygenase beta subunit
MAFPKKIAVVAIAGVVGLCLPGSFAPIGQAVDDPAAVRFTPPPGEETAEVKALIDRAMAAVAGGRPAGDLLSDPDFLPAHPWPRFRRLIREHAAEGSVVLVTRAEPGNPLVVRGTVRSRDGRPMRGALVYVYHTSARGWYSDRAAHIAGQAGDTRHARLFAYLWSGTDGRYEFRTIRPAGYPGTDLPAHIHVEIQGPDGRGPVTEIRFDDDPRLTPVMRQRSREEGFLICPVTRRADGAQEVTADFHFR